MNNWNTYEISKVVLETGTDINQGRKNLPSDRKRKKNNKIFHLPVADSSMILKRMASDASLWLLVVAYLIAALFGDRSESLIGILLIGIAFVCGSFINYRSSMRISNSYRNLLPNAKVTENGISTRLSVYDVEVGDLITFTQGDIIPADARLVSSSALFVAERESNQITGRTEYKKYQKNHDYVTSDPDEFHCPNVVYAGSMVISGKGSAIVSAIGTDTVICRDYNGISIVPENDTPVFLRTFLSKSRRFSLAILTVVIPLILLLIYLQTAGEGLPFDFLSVFVLALTLAATSMSELSISSAEAIVTKELLPSSLMSKFEKHQESKITKLSSAEELAQTDTLLILCPETLIDERKLVRRIYFCGRQYRFDSLNSQQINDFIDQIAPFYAGMPKSIMTANDKVINEFCGSKQCDGKNGKRIKVLKNFPVTGARSCVFDFDEDGTPISYITRSSDLSLLNSCAAFRTEGGGVWKLGEKESGEIRRAFDKYDSFVSLEQSVFYSYNKRDKQLIFEGIVATGEEYPYCDGDLREELLEAGVHPVLVLEEETDRNIEIAYNCGLLKKSSDIAINSEYLQAGLEVSDANLATKIYVGFGRKGTQAISKRLADNSRKVLPIIKDSANRHDVSPFNIFATHARSSFDSVRIASALNIVPDISPSSGGLSDALKAIQACSMAFLKLGIYKNYLIFSAILRILAVLIPLALGYVNNVLSPIALLICGFFCDFASLLSIAYFRGIPVKAKNTISETQKLFYPATSILSAFCAVIVSIVVLFSIGYLTKTEMILAADANIFASIFVLFAQMAALGGFLLILHGRTRAHKFNYCFFFILLSALLANAFIICLPKVSTQVFSAIPNIGVLLYILGAAVVSLILIVILIGSLSSFSSSKHV